MQDEGVKDKGNVGRVDRSLRQVITSLLTKQLVETEVCMREYAVSSRHCGVPPEREKDSAPTLGVELT